MDEHPSSTDPPVPDLIVARPVVAAYAPWPPAPPSPLELPTLTRWSAAGGVALVLAGLCASLVVSVAMQMLLAHREPEASPAAWHNLIIADKWISAALAIAALLSLMRLFRLAPAAFGLRTNRAGAQAAWSLATFGGVYCALLVSVAIVEAMVLAVPGLKQDLSSRLDFLEMLPIGNLTSVLLLLIPVAVHEEVFFRGLLLPFLRRLGCPWMVAVLISAALFASLHISQGWLAIPQVFCVAVALGTFFVLSRSLLAVMAAHFLFDFAQVQLYHVLAPWIEQAAKQL